jgi:hypothetical protein
MTKLIAATLLAGALTASAQFTNVNTGTTANDGTGDNIRAAYTKINANFAIASNLFKATPAFPKSASIAITNETIVVATNSSLVFMLPQATNAPGKHVWVLNALNITNTAIRYTNGLIVWNNQSGTNYTLTNGGQSLQLYAYGTNWLAR